MRVRTNDLTLVALAALGALVTHQLAYVVAAPISSLAMVGSDHGHLSTQWALVAPAAVIAASVFILRQVSHLHLGRGLNRRLLTVATAVLFSGQEIAEAGLGAGDPIAALSRPTTLVGLLLAPLIALAISLLLSEASELVARFLRTPSSIDYGRTVLLPRPISDAAPALRYVVGTPSRGPPRVRL